MRFRDLKTIHYSGYDFETGRIIQGSVIYAVVFVLLVLALLSEDKKLAWLAVALLGLFFAGLVSYFSKKTRSIRKGTVVAALKILTFPASMIG